MRLLTDKEIELIAGGTTDIVVIANTSGGGSVEFTNTNNGMQNASYMGSDGGGGSGDASSGHAAVNVHVANDANFDKAEQAAENLAKALAAIDAALHSHPDSTVLTFPDGKTTTVGQLEAELESTKFVMSDSNFSSTNTGVGTADHSTMTDTLDYTAFEGPGSYADSNYVNQSGLIGIALHELGHLSDAGFSNFQQESSMWNRLEAENHIPHKPSDFYSTDFGLDNEIYADDFAANAASNIGLNIDQFSTQRRSTYSGEDYEGAVSRFADEGGY